MKRKESTESNSLIFMDCADFDKLETNIIDNMKLYESIVLYNAFNTLANILGDINNKKTKFKDIEFDNTFMVQCFNFLFNEEVFF